MMSLTTKGIVKFFFQSMEISLVRVVVLDSKLVNPSWRRTSPLDIIENPLTPAGARNSVSMCGTAHHSSGSLMCVKNAKFGNFGQGISF